MPSKNNLRLVDLRPRWEASLACVLLACASLARAQTTPPPIVAGHALGETVADFQKKEPKAVFNKLVDTEPGRARFNFPNLTKWLFNSSAVFQDGGLVYLEIYVNTASWSPDALSFEEIEIQLVQKFGPPTSANDLKTENGFGAIFHHRADMWDTPSYFAQALEVSPEATSITLMSRGEHEKHLKAEAARKPSL